MTDTRLPDPPDWATPYETRIIHQALESTGVTETGPAIAQLLQSIEAAGLVIVADQQVELVFTTDAAGEYRWAARDRGNHKIIAVSGEGYVTSTHREAMARRLFPTARLAQSSVITVDHELTDAEAAEIEARWIASQDDASTLQEPAGNTTRQYLQPLELRDRGYLQEVNRQFFHPLGLALAVDVDQELDGRGRMLAAIWDERTDPEGWFFAEDELNNDVAQAKANAVAQEVGNKAAERIAVAGSVVQSIPTNLRIWRTVTAPGPAGAEETIRTMWAKGVTPPGPGVAHTIGRSTWELGDDDVWERTVHAWAPIDPENLEPDPS